MTDTIGLQLHKARLERGLTLEQVEQSTHIRAFYIKALEEDDYLSLPSMVQGRGFLRNYADFLGLDVDELLADWSNTSDDQSAASLSGSGRKAADVIAERVEPPEPKPSKRSQKQKRGPASIEPEETQVKTDVEVPSAPPPIPPMEPPGVFGGTAGRAGKPGLDSASIFAEIGQQLKHQRKLLGLSLADVERYTRLRLHYLEALEDGRVDDLPSPVQGRGMLNNYANFLNLNSEALLFRYADGLQTRRTERIGNQPHRKPARQISKSRLAARRFISFDLVIGGILIILLLVFIVWGTSQVISAQKQAAVVPSMPPISEVLLGTGTELVGTNETGTTTAIVQSSNTAQPTQVGGFSGSLNFTPLPSGNNPIQIYVIARQTAWMRVISDGKMTFEGRAQSGSAYPFAGNHQVEFITGNAAAFQIFFNQEDLGSLGTEGQVIDLIFDPNGLIAPTATNTPTITQTLPATATATPSLAPSPTTGLPAINTVNPSLVP